MRFTPIFLATLLLCFIAPASSAQTPAPPQDEVLFFATVMNSRGEWVGGLTPQNFRIREGDSDVEISTFGAGEASVSVGILIDTSPSTIEFLGYIAEAMSYFTKASKQETEYFVMRFDSTQSILVEPTSDREAVLNGMRTLAVTPRSTTATYDAIDAGIDRVLKGRHEKKALIVFGDAAENGSKRSFDEVKRKVRGSGVLVYGISKSDPRDAASQIVQAGQARIDELATLTGGRSMYATSRKELLEISYRTGEELRYQYRIGFRPRVAGNKSNRPDWRKFYVKLDVPPAIKSRFGDMRVRAREGYYLGPKVK